jgi:hypothetical protein
VLVLVAAAESSSQPSWAWIIGIAGIAVGVALAIWTWRRELANRRREHERQLERDRQEREGRYIWRFVRRWQVDRNPPALWLHVTIESTGTRPVQIRDIALRSELGQPGVVLEAWKTTQSGLRRSTLRSRFPMATKRTCGSMLQTSRRSVRRYWW